MFKYKKVTLIITLVLVFLSNLLIYASSINDDEVFIRNGSRNKKLIALTLSVLTSKFALIQPKLSILIKQSSINILSKCNP